MKPFASRATSPRSAPSLSNVRVVWSYAIVKPEYFRNAQREHRAMLKAIRERDRKRLIELCAHHLDISRTAYLETHRLRFAGRE